MAKNTRRKESSSLRWDFLPAKPLKTENGSEAFRKCSHLRIKSLFDFHISCTFEEASRVKSNAQPNVYIFILFAEAFVRRHAYKISKEIL